MNITDLEIMEGTNRPKYGLLVRVPDDNGKAVQAIEIYAKPDGSRCALIIERNYKETYVRLPSQVIGFPAKEQAEKLISMLNA